MRAANPLMFYLGLALLCGSLIELHRWPWLEQHLADSDLDQVRTLSVAAFLELDGNVGSLLGERVTFDELTEFPLRAALVLGVLGLVALMARRPRAAAALCAAGVGTTGVTLLAVGLDLRMLDRYGHGCGPARVVLWSVGELPLMSSALFWLGAVAAASWLVLHVQQRFRPAGALAAAAVAMGMLGVVLDVSRRASAQGWLEGPAPARNLEWLGALLVIGLLVTWRRPVLTSHFVSLSVLCVGLVSLIPAIAIARDTEVPVETRVAWIDADTLPTSHCLPARLSATFVPGDRDFDASLRYLQETRRDLGAAQMVHVNLAAVPTSDTTGISRLTAAARAAGIHSVDLISIRDLPDPLWTRPVVHRHACALRIELSDTGRRVSSFADMAELVRSVDEAGGTLTLRAD